MPRKSRPTFRDFFPYATLVQKELARLYIPSGIKADEVRTTVALDVSYSKERAFAAAVVSQAKGKKMVEEQTGVFGVHFPYIPGYLYLREAPSLLRVLAQVESAYDLILVDAHGRLHPRRAGLATIVGVLMEKPAVGIAKSLLTGEVRGEGRARPVFLRGEVEGLCLRDGRTFYASPGNMMSIGEIGRWLEGRDYAYPEELARADALSKKLRVISESGGPS
jgi:deoxyribonuclease V